MVMETGTAPAEALTRFYADLDRQDMAPLWESLHALVPRTPTTKVEAVVWVLYVVPTLYFFVRAMRRKPDAPARPASEPAVAATGR